MSFLLPSLCDEDRSSFPVPDDVVHDFFFLPSWEPPFYPQAPRAHLGSSLGAFR